MDSIAIEHISNIKMHITNSNTFKINIGMQKPKKEIKLKPEKFKIQT